mmetsp:Transcript_32654/g.85714  ORF Transcript_32654/g.85714 Transcript_32654/m.85714 type:complete len:301 (-) Transcript_32654:182-1084(-)
MPPWQRTAAAPSFMAVWQLPLPSSKNNMSEYSQPHRSRISLKWFALPGQCFPEQLIIRKCSGTRSPQRKWSFSMKLSITSPHQAAWVSWLATASCTPAWLRARSTAGSSGKIMTGLPAESTTQRPCSHHLNGGWNLSALWSKPKWLQHVSSRSKTATSGTGSSSRGIGPSNLAGGAGHCRWPFWPLAGPAAACHCHCCFGLAGSTAGTVPFGGPAAWPAPGIHDDCVGRLGAGLPVILLSSEARLDSSWRSLVTRRARASAHPFAPAALLASPNFCWMLPWACASSSSCTCTSADISSIR